MDRIELTTEELRFIMEETSKRACEQMLTAIGVDTRNPVEMQKDLAYIRNLRMTTDAISKKGILTLVAMVATGIGAALWLGIKGFLN